MPAPFDAYRDGYEKGRKDGAGGVLAEITMGMLRDDPGGHFASGYRDGAAGKKFSPPSEEHKAVPRKSAGAPLTPLEKEWYRLCDSSAFIPKHIADYYVTTLAAQGSQVAIVIGLNDFTSHTCPKCGAEGQFKIRFLGRLEHPDPECGWTGYMGTGSYIGLQFAQSFHWSVRAGGSVKDDADRKGDKAGGWMQGILLFLFVAVFRAMLALVLIPLHCLVAAFEPGAKQSDLVKRIVTLAAFLLALGLGVYFVQRTPSSPPVAAAPATVPSVTYTPPITAPVTPTQKLVGAVAEDRNWEISGLISAGADPNGTYSGDPEHPTLNGYPFLVVAVRYCGEKMVRALLDGGANPNVVDKDGRTALSYASENCGSTTIPEMLRQQSARQGVALGDTPAPQLATSTATSTAPDAKPTFDCSKAHTPIELLICRDSQLAGLEVEMVSAYKQTMARLSPDDQVAFRKDHLAWFKNYTRMCGQTVNAGDAGLKACVANFLSAHTNELRNRQ